MNEHIESLRNEGRMRLIKQILESILSSEKTSWVLQNEFDFDGVKYTAKVVVFIEKIPTKKHGKSSEMLLMKKGK